MKWKIENMKRQLSDGLVIKVNYRVVAKDKELIADKRGAITLTGDPSSPDFIPFENLTEEDVITWVRANLGVVEISTIEAEVQSVLDAKIAARSARQTATGLPWGNRLV